MSASLIAVEYFPVQGSGKKFYSIEDYGSY